MGSDAHLVVVGGRTTLVERAARRIEDLERKWSRFLGDSEISGLNRSAGEPVAVSGDTIVLVRRSIEAWRLSGGAFDPTVLGAVIRAGYDRSFDLLGPDPSPGHSTLGIGADDIAVDDHAGTVRLPEHTGFDPGGIGKGLAADIVTAEMIEAGADGVCVNLGGDLRVAGTSPDGGGWTVAIEHPWVPDPIALIGIGNGAVATSTTLRRRWISGGAIRHHVIDPQSGLPSDTDLTLATTIAAEAWVAEVLAKAVLLAGARHPFDIVGGTGVQALVVDQTGRIQTTPRVRDYLGGTELPPSIVPTRAEPSHLAT